MNVKELPANFNRYGRWSKVSKAGKSYVEGFIPTVTKIRGNRSNSFFRLEISEHGETYLFAIKNQNKPPYFIGKIFPESLALELACPEDEDEWSNKLAMQKRVLYKLSDKTIEMRYTVSSASPLIKYDFKNTKALCLAGKIKTDNLGYRFLYIPGIGLKKLAKPGFLTTTEIFDNFVLLYHGTPGDFPILIAFNKKPKSIEWGGEKSTARVGMDYLRILFDSSEFTCYIGLLKGSALTNTKLWTDKIPTAEIKNAAVLAHESLAFPIDLFEEASVNWKQKTVTIARKYRFLITHNEFGIEATGIAACPPYVFYPHSRGKLRSPEVISIFTLYGLTKFTRGETVVYELPIDPATYTELDMPSRSDMKTPLEKEMQKRIDADANNLMNEWNRVPADENPYLFCGVAQQLLACYPLLNGCTRKRALDWVRKTLEWYFINDHPSGRKYYYLDENFNFYTLYGHGDPRDVDCLLGMVFACVGQYVRHSNDIEFMKAYYPRYYNMFYSYFNQVIDPITGNTFCQPNGKLNWVSDTLEAYIGLNYIVRHARRLKKKDWVDSVRINAIYRCAAIGQLYGWDIARSIPGFEDYYLDPTYELSSVRCVHTWEGWQPLPYRREEPDSFWEIAASLWPISPEICLLYKDIEYSHGLNKLFLSCQRYWPQWYKLGKMWRGTKDAKDVGGGFKANALIAMLAFFDMESQEVLFNWYQLANKHEEFCDKYKWNTWKEFPLAMILRMGKR